MTTDDDVPVDLRLIGYQKLTNHGFALPCFGRSEGANTVYTARPSEPGDPTARIAGFEVYESDNIEPLPQNTRTRRSKVGDAWLDVFLWAGKVYIGTKFEIWKATSGVRSSIAAHAPLSLLNLVEGVSGMVIADFANAAYAWLQQRRDPRAASEWQVDVYLRGLAVRGLRRRLGKATYSKRVRLGLQNVKLALDGKTLTLVLPATLTELIRITAYDLYDYIKAAREFGFSPIIVRDGLSRLADNNDAADGGTTLLMRLRQGRGGTQTQIPFRVLDSFFRDETRVRSLSNGITRAMTLSLSGSRRNTMKLQLPEIAHMSEPVARFERTSTDITYEIFDAHSSEGVRIKGQLEEGLRDGATRQTNGAATWWRIL